MANPQEIETQLLPLWPDAGKTLGFRSRSATYAAADKGLIKTVRLGKLLKVPKVWLDRKVRGDDEAA